MRFSNLYDMHTHSLHSFDGVDKCIDICNKSVELGAKGIAITDHCDIDGKDMDENELCKNQIADLEFCKASFANRLDIIKGLEIGQGIYRRERTENILKNYNYDFILGSLHNLENMEDFMFLEYSKLDVYGLLGEYFKGLLELTEWGGFDSLAHLTYPIRYIVARDKINVDMSKFDEVIDAIFENLVKNKKALEINTSGLFMPMNDTLPNIRYVKRFKELGGEYITVGSDSHYAKTMFRGINSGYEIALKCGFEHITVFKKREPLKILIK